MFFSICGASRNDDGVSRNDDGENSRVVVENTTYKCIIAIFGQQIQKSVVIIRVMIMKWFLKDISINKISLYISEGFNSICLGTWFLLPRSRSVASSRAPSVPSVWTRASNKTNYF